jgi:hypothetical protein
LTVSRSLVTDWRTSMVIRGHGWHADVGAFSTPITGGGAGTVLDLDQPEFIISVPSGQVLVPIRLLVACHTPLIAADANEIEILIAADRAAAYDGTGTVTAETPTNMRSDLTTTCPATVVSAATADVTDPTLGIELARATRTADSQTAVGVLWGELSLLYEPVTPPWFYGPCAIYGYWGGTVAVPGFAHLDFLAFAAGSELGVQ